MKTENENANKVEVANIILKTARCKARAQEVGAMGIFQPGCPMSFYVEVGIETRDLPKRLLYARKKAMAIKNGSMPHAERKAVFAKVDGRIKAYRKEHLDKARRALRRAGIRYKTVINYGVESLILK